MFNGHPLKRRADYIFAFSSILYLAVFVGSLYEQPWWYGALYWTVQSALIGSVADWFAVNALFRRPLSVSFHTELIPRNKDRFIEGISALVSERLLTTRQWNQLTKDISFVTLLDSFLCSPKGQFTLTLWASQALEKLFSKEAQAVVINKAALMMKEQLHLFSIATKGREYLTSEIESERAQEWIRPLFNELNRIMDSPEGIAFIEKELEGMLAQKKQTLLSRIFIGLGELFNIVNVSDMAKAFQQELSLFLQKGAENKELREAFLLHLKEALYSSSWEKEVAPNLDAAFSAWVNHLPFEEFLKEQTLPRLSIYVKRDSQGQSPLGIWLALSIIGLWKESRKNGQWASKVEKALQKVMIELLKEFQYAPILAVKTVLAHFDKERLNQFVEEKVIEDLSWIRINGAIVGAVLGLSLWALLHFAYDPLVPVIKAWALRSFGG